MLKLISLVLFTTILSGCSSWFKKQPPVEPKVITKIETVPIRIFQPPLPMEIQLREVNFWVITKENFQEKMVEIEKLMDGNFVIFALTPFDYENMVYNFQEIRRFNLQQKELIIYYRKATTESEGTTAEDWQKHNKTTP